MAVILLNSEAQTLQIKEASFKRNRLTRVLGGTNDNSLRSYFKVSYFIRIITYELILLVSGSNFFHSFIVYGNKEFQVTDHRNRRVAIGIYDLITYVQHYPPSKKVS